MTPYISTRINLKSILILLILLFAGSGVFGIQIDVQAEESKKSDSSGLYPAIKVLSSEKKSAYFTSRVLSLSGVARLMEAQVISGPPSPPLGFDIQRTATSLPVPDKAAGVMSLTVPAYDWVFGCSAVSGAIIAGYYDRNGYPDMYTGPANSGVMPLNNSDWPTWSDGNRTYPNLPLAASHQGVDGRTATGSIDDYWISYNDDSDDPYVTNSWAEHSWGDAIGDYMKTSQSAYNNTDGSTTFYNSSNSATPLTCSDMVSYGISESDGTYGRKLFYEARGYTVTDCYNQNTDNVIEGGFSFAQFVAEIDAGRPVMLNLQGHTVVGVGYDDSDNTVYLNDTWDYATHEMPWNGSYSGMPLLSVSIVNLAQASTGTLTGITINGASTINESSTSSYTATASWSDGSTSTVIPAWSENSDYATINSSGTLTASSVSENQSVTITASYTSGGVTETATHAVTIINYSNTPLSDALDSSSLSWTTAGDAVWFGQAVTTYDGEDAAESGDISDNQESYLETTVTGPGTLSFYWRVSSESGFDFLRFYIDGVEQEGAISGASDWAVKSYAIPEAGSHILRWSYTKDYSESYYSDCGWLDKVSWTQGAVTVLEGLTIVGPTQVDENSTVNYTAEATWSNGDISSLVSADWSENSDFATIDANGNLTVSDVAADHTVTISASYTKDGITQTATMDVTVADMTTIVPLGEALDNTTLTWSTSGSADWFGQSGTAYSGESAAQSGVLQHSEEAYLDTTVSGTGTIRFYWKVSSESNYDFLRFYIDGVEQAGAISGTTDWAIQSFDISTDGSHSLRWAYTKDGSVSYAPDCGWVDLVSWIPDGPYLIGISIDGPETVSENSSAMYSVTALWSNGETQTVTPEWSENSANASVTSAGELVVSEIEADEAITLTASYSSGGIVETAQLEITLLDAGSGSITPILMLLLGDG